MYIDSQQDAGQRRKRKKKTENSQTCLKTKKERQGRSPPLKKNSQNAFAHQRKDIQMLRNHASSNIGSASTFVNGLVTVVSLILIAGAYFSAIGQFVA